MERASEFATDFLLNAAWQVTAIALVACLCSYLLRDAAARYRHALWVTALVLSLALPSWSALDVSSAATPQSSATSADAFPQREILPAAPSYTAATEVAVTDESRPTLGLLLRRRSQTMTPPPRLSSALALGFACFLLFRLGALCRSWRRTQRLRRGAHDGPLPARMSEIAERCCAALRLQSVPVMCSTSATAPVTIGARRPVIILPESFYAEMPDNALVSVLGHEMAHVARRDYALNLVYEFLLLPVSFHPLARFIKRRVDSTRELACDDLVTKRLLDRGLYARELVRVASALVSPARQTFTLGIADTDILEERIMKLTRTPRLRAPRAMRLLMLAAFSLLCLSGLIVSLFSFNVRSVKAAAAAYAADASVTQTVSAQSGGELSLQAAAFAPKQGDVPTRDEQTQEPQELKTDDPQERAQAACDAAQRRAHEAIPLLISMLDDERPVKPLRCWDNVTWSPALSTFKQPSPGEQAALALASLGGPAVEPLTNALGDVRASVRRNAAWAIGELTNMRVGQRSAAVQPLISLLDDADEWVRLAAARALGEIRDRRAVERLLAALMDSSWRLRELAAWSLGEMRDERAVPALGKALLEDARAEVREMAAWALGEIRDPQSTPVLQQALHDAELRVRDKAQWALSEIEDN